MRRYLAVLFVALCMCFLTSQATAVTRVTNLLAFQTNGAVTLTFPTPTPPGGTTFTNIDIRYSPTAINALNWNSITNRLLVDTLATVGMTNIVDVIDLLVGTNYYFALKLQDSHGTWSQISNASLGKAGSNTTFVTLLWDKSPSVEVTGYNVYWGTVSGNYTNKVSVGQVTFCVMSVEYGITYYLACTAFTDSGLESDLSNEVSYQTPAPP